jgi:hypothetical protein
MDIAGWEIVSVFPAILPPEKLNLGEQQKEEYYEGGTFTFIFKQIL